MERRLRVLAVVVLACGAGLTGGASHQESADFDYSALFAGADWARSRQFLDWATPIPLVGTPKVPCSDTIRSRIAGPAETVLLCEQVARTLSSSQTNPTALVWALIRLPQRLPSGHDCRLGLAYLGERVDVRAGNSVADCDYVREFVEDPADTPVMLFRIKRTAELGIVFDGHGAECGGRAVLREMGGRLEVVHHLYWECSQ